MELAKIEELLEYYFEGKTTLEQEQVLQDYFAGNDIAPHLAEYSLIFQGFAAGRNEKLESNISVPHKNSKIKPMWYSIAAMLVVALTVAGFLWKQPATLSQEEKEAVAAFKETKKALDLLSKNFNEGAEELAYINQFTKSKNKILK